jgi:hypothetical protein
MRGFFEGRSGPLWRVVGGRDSGRVAGVVARLAGADASRWAGRSAREWIDGLELRDGATALTEALLRLTTYVADLERLPADLALTQARRGLLRGVTYLDGGWSSLVDGLVAACSARGGTLRAGVAASAVVGEPGAWRVVTASGEEIPASAVVVATGAPAAAANLLPMAAEWGDIGPAVTAACLDIGLRRPGPRFVLGVDQPLYLSPHCPPGDLAPAGGGLVHVLRYGARTAVEDGPDLEAFATVAGVCDADVVVRRFLARMVVASALPSPEVGLAGRPPVTLSEAPGVFLAGDWVGPEGWLADASLASGEKAGLLAAKTASRQLRTAGRAA